MSKVRIINKKRVSYLMLRNWRSQKRKAVTNVTGVPCVRFELTSHTVTLPFTEFPRKVPKAVYAEAQNFAPRRIIWVI